MKEIINKISEIGVAETDARTAKELADQLIEIHRATYENDCVIRFINEKDRNSLKFNLDTQSYNIFLAGLNDKVSVVEFPFFDFYSSRPLSRKEKLLSIIFHEMRHRAQQGGIDLFRPESKMSSVMLKEILRRMSFMTGGLFWEQMIIYEKREFDAKFITAVCCSYYRMNCSFSRLSKIIFWEPKKRH